ncbi:FAD-binding protein [Alphaproteobacteria bacterium]|nr:FAD-binding protein [Alphaproteobacteria bacterium]|tara:strand:- start:234 stop:1151 length:918 start_codon:yes stop_codon:yes gene_type:complete
MSCLVIIEQEEGLPNRPSLATITAAKEIGDDVDLLVLNPAKTDEIIKIKGIRTVLTFKEKEIKILAESFTEFLTNIVKNYEYILSPSGTFSKNFMPRLASILDVQPISDVIKIHSKDTFDRPIYAGNAIATVKSKDKIKMLTIRGTAFQPQDYGDNNASISILSEINISGKTKYINSEVTKSERPEISSAKIIISGGRGVGSKENFSIIEEFADKVGGAIGASRAAVDAGYISNDYQVGQTGKVVAPELYIAVGISGAIQHLAGMKDSKIIVAINKDEDAPIFQVADYGLVGDLFKVLPDIIKLI